MRDQPAYPILEYMRERVKSLVENRTSLLVMVVVIALLLAGLVYSLYLGDALRFLPDERDYVTLAEGLAVRGSYSLDGETPTAFRPPGYPLALALFYFLGARIVHFRMFNFILLGLSIVLVHKILMDKSTPYGSALGVFFAAGYPLFFYTAGTLYPQTLAAFLFLSTVFLLTKSSLHIREYLIGGFLLGYLIITVPIFLFTLPVFVVWIWVSREKRIMGILLLCIGSLILVGSWTVRNYSIFNRFIPISTNSGFNLLVGNSDHTKPNSGTNVDITEYTEQGSNLGELERDRYYRSEAINFIQNNPLKAARLYMLKVLNYFNYQNDLATDSEESTIKNLTMLFTYTPLLLVFILRIVFFRRVNFTTFDFFLVLIYFLSAFVTAIFFTRIRFRIPFEYLIILVDARFLEHYLRKIFYRGQGGLRTSLGKL